MSENSIVKISRMILRNDGSESFNLEELNEALLTINIILEKEKTRKIHIKKELGFQQTNDSLIEKLSEISYLNEHLENTEQNIKNLTNYIDILSTKIAICELQSNSYNKKIIKNIDLNKSFLYN